MKVKVKGTKVLDEMLASDKKFILNIGGVRSSKTWSSLQWILIYCINSTNQGKNVTIIRKNTQSLRSSVMIDFFNLLNEQNLYKNSNHNKNNNTYNLFGNTIRFISIDQTDKLRGIEHDVVFLDEVSEISKEEVDQVLQRTKERVLMAQNPSNELHWSFKYISDPRCLYIHSTFKDNHFLSEETINQILSYEDIDEDMWNIFGLGLPTKK